LLYKDHLSYINNSSFASDEKLKEIYLMKRKREMEFFNPKNNHNIQKDNSFSIINSNKIENIRKLNESRKTINESQPDIINSITNNFKKLLSESSNNLKQEENNMPKIIINDKEGNFINNSSIIRNPLTKLTYFNIEKDINKKHLLEFGTSNEIKVLKNNKIVYINSNSLNSYSVKRHIKKLKKINFVKINNTSSKYRGVSRNGNKWQVLSMAKNKKYYLGSYNSEEFAARIYDIHAIKMRGIKARTNFRYNNVQLKNIYRNTFYIKCDNLDEIMNQINN